MSNKMNYWKGILFVAPSIKVYENYIVLFTPPDDSVILLFSSRWQRLFSTCVLRTDRVFVKILQLSK